MAITISLPRTDPDASPAVERIELGDFATRDEGTATAAAIMSATMTRRALTEESWETCLQAVIAEQYGHLVRY